MLDEYFRQYGFLAIFAAVALCIPAGMLLGSWMLGFIGIRPKKPDAIKLSIYECGFETISGNSIKPHKALFPRIENDD